MSQYAAADAVWVETMSKVIQAENLFDTVTRGTMPALVSPPHPHPTPIVDNHSSKLHHQWQLAVTDIPYSLKFFMLWISWVEAQLRKFSPIKFQVHN